MSTAARRLLRPNAAAASGDGAPIAKRPAGDHHQQQLKDLVDIPVPTHFRCPISLEMMRDPVAAPTGITYDRESIEAWLDHGHGTCPITGRPVRHDELIPNHAMRRMIQEWCVANRALGVERIPTPRIPLSAAEVADVLAAIGSASRRGDGASCSRMAKRLKDLGKESDRNRRFILSGGAARALAAAFCQLAGDPMGSSASSVALEDILSATVAFFPLDDEARQQLSSPASMRSIVAILRQGELTSRVNAIQAVRELASSTDPKTLEAIAKTTKMCETLVELIAKPVSPQAIKAALVTTFHLVSGDERGAARFADLGLVPPLIETLVGADRGTSEKAVAVLDAVLASSKGCERAHGNALAVPVLVKMMFRVSEMATEFAVSALWRLCRGCPDGRCAGEAAQVGAFQKLLLQLQVGCSPVTKERVSELLKLLNASKSANNNVECIETADFKGLKRPF